MNKHHRALAVVLLLIDLSCFGLRVMAQRFAQARHSYDSDRPLTEPRVFGDGVISTGDFESHPAFTPEGKTLYFLKDTPTFSFWTIVVSHWGKGKWTMPEVAPFSGQYSDADPFISPDGSKFFFISNRPLDKKPNGKPKDDLDIWMMEKTATGWSEPKNLGAPVNSSADEWYPTMAANGTLYFGSSRVGGKGRTDIYRAPLVNGKYATPENLGDAINTKSDEFEPFIAPDESFLIFMAARPGGQGRSDLYFSAKRNGAWTEAVNLGDKINSSGSEYSPKISPDGKYFFWTSTREIENTPRDKPLTYQQLMRKLRSPGNGLGDIYQIDLSALNLAR